MKILKQFLVVIIACHFFGISSNKIVNLECPEGWLVSGGGWYEAKAKNSSLNYQPDVYQVCIYCSRNESDREVEVCAYDTSFARNITNKSINFERKNCNKNKTELNSSNKTNATSWCKNFDICSVQHSMQYESIRQALENLNPVLCSDYGPDKNITDSKSESNEIVELKCPEGSNVYGFQGKHTSQNSTKSFCLICYNKDDRFSLCIIAKIQNENPIVANITNLFVNDSMCLLETVKDKPKKCDFSANFNETKVLGYRTNLSASINFKGSSLQIDESNLIITTSTEEKETFCNCTKMSSERNRTSSTDLQSDDSDFEAMKTMIAIGVSVFVNVVTITLVIIFALRLRQMKKENPRRQVEIYSRNPYYDEMNDSIETLRGQTSIESLNPYYDELTT